MPKFIKSVFAAVCVVWLFAGCGKSSEDGAFVKGADISSLQAVEDYGGKFYDLNGKEKDAIQILKENGVNYLRIRIWNKPTLSFDAGDYCDLAHTIEFAKRIKKEGMRYLLDFHYSDWWADPENQRVPKDWEDMDATEMAQALYDYTADVLKQLDAAGAYPDMVQIGNEIGSGMLWDYGRYAETGNLTQFINSGIKAVRDTTPKNKKVDVMIHIQDGGAVDKSERFFQMLTQNGVTDFDIIGLSYYPYWHGTMADMKDNVRNLKAKFNKRVMLAEFAFPFTDDNADETPNIIGRDQALEAGFEPTVDNQKLVTELVMNACFDAGGEGIFYWEPVWLAVKGAGAVRGGGNGWENQALFDYNGKALQSITAFKITPGKDAGDRVLTVYMPEGIDINVDSTREQLQAKLPKAVKALYSNGDVKDIDVTWDVSNAPDVLSEFISHTFNGKAAGFDTRITANVIHENLLNNLGFEDGETGWIIEKSTGAGIIRNDGDSFPKSGKWSFHYWDDKAFTINLYQTTVIGDAGGYSLSLWSQGAGGTLLALRLYIADENGNEIAAKDFRNDGWNVWQHPFVTAALDAGQKVRIGVIVEGQYNDWGTIDDFAFFKGLPEDGEFEQDGQKTAAPDAAVTDEGNLIKNGSFELGVTDWEIEKDTEAGTARNDGESTPKSGIWSFHYWYDKPFNINVYQKAAIGETGSYTLNLWNQGGESGTFELELYALDANGNAIGLAANTNSGWADWHETALTLDLTAGTEITVGARIKGGADDWGTIDDFALVKTN